jgi:hypothetical protein
MDTIPSSNETSTSATTTSTASQAAEQLKSTLSSADGSVNQGIQTLGLVLQARQSQASRTAAALKAQYGANDPRVKAAEASVTATKTTIARISMVRQQLAVPVVQVATAGWALQGYVLDTNYQPMVKFTVFLVDANHEFLKQYGFSYTDDTGYFLINYPGDSGQAAPGAQTAPAAATAQTAPAAATAQTAQLFIAAVNADANPVYLGSTAFQPVLGTATYQNIFVPAGGQTLGDPTSAIRAVAFPSKGAPAQPGTTPSNPTKS